MKQKALTMFLILTLVTSSLTMPAFANNVVYLGDGITIVLPCDDELDARASGTTIFVSGILMGWIFGGVIMFASGQGPDAWVNHVLEIWFRNPNVREIHIQWAD